LAAWRERCRDDRDTRRRGNEEEEAVGVASMSLGYRCPYRWSVVVMLACPMISWSIIGGYPA
jgi:hypothetical protein